MSDRALLAFTVAGGVLIGAMVGILMWLPTKPHEINVTAHIDGPLRVELVPLERKPSLFGRHTNRWRGNWVRHCFLPCLRLVSAYSPDICSLNDGMWRLRPSW
jgi:hypothetical protein